MFAHIEEADRIRKANIARHEERIPKILKMAESVDAMVQAVGLLDKADAPRDTLYDLVANTLSKWCELRHKMSKVGFTLEGLDTPFPDIGEVMLTNDDCDFSSGRYNSAYVIGYRVSKSDEIKPLHSGWLNMRGMPRGWHIENRTDVHRFEMNDEGHVTLYKSEWKHKNMYVANEIIQIADQHELAEGKYTMRTYTYVLADSRKKPEDSQ